MNKFAKAFNGDFLVKNEYENLIKKHNIEVLLESGSHEGETSEYMCSLGLPVITTEIDKKRYETTKKKLSKYANAMILFGDSEKELRKIFDEIKNKKIIAFLDAHWFNDQVLERELQLLSELEKSPVILIHDFKVPNKNFGYDCYNGMEYSYKNYKKFFDNVYGENKYSYKYTEESLEIKTEQRRGVIFLEPLLE